MKFDYAKTNAHWLKIKNMKKIKIIVLPLLVFATFFGCSENKAKEGPRVSKNEILTAPHDDYLVTDYLKKRYKEYDSDNNCLIRKTAEEVLCTTLNVIYSQEEDQGRNLYVVESGIPVGDDGKLAQAHVYTGTITLFIINQNNEKLKIVSQSEEISNGAYGTPNPVKIYRPGSGTTRGWILSHGDMHQGYSGSRISLYLQKDRQIVLAGAIDTAYDDTNACVAENDDCSTQTISSTVETIHSEKTDYYDLKVKTKSKKKDKGKNEVAAENEFIVKFNKEKFEYETDLPNKLYEGLEY